MHVPSPHREFASHNRAESLVCFVVVLLPATLSIDGPAVGWLLDSQPVIDYVNHSSRHGNVNSCFKPLFFFSCICLMASMARSVNCLGRKKAVQVHLIGAKPIVQVKR